VLIHKDEIEVRPPKIRRGVFVNQGIEESRQIVDNPVQFKNPNILDSDPFDFEETDLMKTGAPQSSLWEVLVSYQMSFLVLHFFTIV
jgi:hypothetical protein